MMGHPALKPEPWATNESFIEMYGHADRVCRWWVTAFEEPCDFYQVADWLFGAAQFLPSYNNGLHGLHEELIFLSELVMERGNLDEGRVQ